MADEIVSALNNLTAVNKELAGKRQAEADKESQDRKDERNKLQKIIDDGKKSEADRNEAKDELRKLNKKEDLAKEVSTEISRSAAALLGISDEQFKSSKEQQLIQKDQGKSTEKVIEAIKLSTVDPLAERKNAAAIMEAQLIANGRVATQNAAYNREMSAIKQEEIKARRDQAESPAERAEIQAELEAERKKNQGLLGKIAGGLGGLLKQGKEKVVGAVKGVFGFIKGLAIAGLGLALVAFLNSPLWEETKTYIVKTLIPTLGRFYDAFFGPKGGFINGLKELFGDKDGIGGIVLGIGTVVAALAAFKVLTIAFKMVKGFKVIQAGFTSMKLAMAAMKLPLAAALVPLLPIIAIAAAIGVVIFAMKEALSDFQKVMEDGGSITEAFKVGGAKFLGFILGFIPSLITDLVGFVAGLLGFEEVEAKMNTIDPIQMISDAITDIFDGIADFFSGIGNDFSVIGGNIADMGKKFLQAILQTVLPKPGEGGFFNQMISKVIPNEVYEFAGMNPKTGEIIPPDVNDMISSSLKPNALGKVVGKPDFENRMDSRAKQLYDAKLAQTSGQGAPIIVSAPSTNVIDNSSSSSTLTSTSLTNNNPQVNAINYAR